MFLKKIIILSIALLASVCSFSQETLPVYSDYLTDNVYLIHPAAAGVGNCAKLRMTGRQNWFGHEDAPQLLTLSFHSYVGNNSGLGVIAFKDQNGYHSQIGGQFTYAYHVKFDDEKTNQLSFGLSAMAVRNTLDSNDFIELDPVIQKQVNSEFYVNADAGLAYHFKGLFAYATAKNLLLSARSQYNSDFEPLNLRRYLFTLGYFFGKKRSKLYAEPSVMFQHVEHTKEQFVDANLKLYAPFDNGQFWGGVSYRRGLDDSETEASNHFTPILGVNIGKFVVSYSYTYQQNDVVFDNGGFHQITLGFDMLCRGRFKRLASCPNLSNSF